MTRSEDHPAQQHDVELSSLWRAVGRSLRPLLLATLAVGAITFTALSLVAPRYTSESQLVLAAKSSNPFPDGTGRGSTSDTLAPRLDREAVNTHARALLAPTLLLRVADDMKLRNLAEFNPAVGTIDTAGAILRLAGIGAPLHGENEDDLVLGTIRRQLMIAPVKDSRIIPIRFTSSDPDLAAQFANRLASAYRTSLVTTPVEETSQVVKVLAPKVEQLKREVIDAEAEVERFRARTGQFRSGSQRTPVTDQRMAALNDELIKAETAKAEAEARWRTATEMMRAGGADILPDVQKSPLIQGLVSQRVRLERQVAEAGAALLPAHPRMRQLSADLAGLKAQIVSEVRKLVQSLEKEYRSATLKVDAANRQIERLQTHVVGQSGAEAELKAQESTAAAKRTELERLQKILEDNRTVVSTRQVPVEAQVIAARASAVPVSPKRTAMTMIAMAATLILGLALVITRTLVTPPQPLRHPDSARGNTSNSPYSTTAPRTAEPSPQRVEPALPAARPAPPFAATTAAATGQLPAPVEALLQRIDARPGTAGGFRTLVTTHGPALDPLPQAQALAGAMAANGQRVVLIVWSLTGKGLSHSGTPRPGLTDLIQGRASFEQVISRLGSSDIHLIEPGPAPEMPEDVLNGDQINLTLDALDEAYDQIVVTSTNRDAAALFGAVEGRFDAAVLLTDGPEDSRPPAGRLLGFDVADIDIVPWRVARSPGRIARQKPTSAGRRMEPVG